MSDHSDDLELVWNAALRLRARYSYAVRYGGTEFSKGRVAAVDAILRMLQQLDDELEDIENGDPGIRFWTDNRPPGEVDRRSAYIIDATLGIDARQPAGHERDPR